MTKEEMHFAATVVLLIGGALMLGVVYYMGFYWGLLLLTIKICGVAAAFYKAVKE